MGTCGREGWLRLRVLPDGVDPVHLLLAARRLDEVVSVGLSDDLEQVALNVALHPCRRQTGVNHSGPMLKGCEVTGPKVPTHPRERRYPPGTTPGSRAARTPRRGRPHPGCQEAGGGSDEERPGTPGGRPQVAHGAPVTGYAAAGAAAAGALLTLVGSK